MWKDCKFPGNYKCLLQFVRSENACFAAKMYLFLRKCIGGHCCAGPAVDRRGVAGEVRPGGGLHAGHGGEERAAPDLAPLFPGSKEALRSKSK